MANFPTTLKSIASLVSVRSAVSELTTATSFVPVILIVTLPLADLSWLVTVNVSVTTCPPSNSLCAESAV